MNMIPAALNTRHAARTHKRTALPGGSRRASHNCPERASKRTPTGIPPPIHLPIAAEGGPTLRILRQLVAVASSLGVPLGDQPRVPLAIHPCVEPGAAQWPVRRPRRRAVPLCNSSAYASAKRSDVAPALLAPLLAPRLTSARFTSLLWRVVVGAERIHTPPLTVEACVVRGRGQQRLDAVLRDLRSDGGVAATVG